MWRGGRRRDFPVGRKPRLPITPRWALSRSTACLMCRRQSSYCPLRWAPGSRSALIVTSKLRSTKCLLIPVWLRATQTRAGLLTAVMGACDGIGDPRLQGATALTSRPAPSLDRVEERHEVRELDEASSTAIIGIGARDARDRRRPAPLDPGRDSEGSRRRAQRAEDSVDRLVHAGLAYRRDAYAFASRASIESAASQKQRHERTVRAALRLGG